VKEILGVEGMYQEFIAAQQKEIEVLHKEEALPLPGLNPQPQTLLNPKP